MLPRSGRPGRGPGRAGPARSGGPRPAGPPRSRAGARGPEVAVDKQRDPVAAGAQGLARGEEGVDVAVAAEGDEQGEHGGGPRGPCGPGTRGRKERGDALRSVSANPALEADTRGRPSPMQDAAADQRSTRMSSTGRRPDGGGPRRARSPPGSRRSALTSGPSPAYGARAPDRPDRRLRGRRPPGAGGRVPTAGHRPRRDDAALPGGGGASGRGPRGLARDREGPRSSAFTGRW
jgi:hypothetical protein